MSLERISIKSIRERLKIKEDIKISFAYTDIHTNKYYTIQTKTSVLTFTIDSFGSLYYKMKKDKKFKFLFLPEEHFQNLLEV